MAPQQPKSTASLFTSSVGPNATVLKLGANAERQQAQKAGIQQPKGPVERPPVTASRTTPAPLPPKSPWAALPPVDKVSPVAINPSMAIGQLGRYPPAHNYGQSPSPMSGPSATQEISADDFTRSWRDSQPSQPRELYMPSSGRYEPIPDNRRRSSKHDQNFRTPAVLQRPSQPDPHAPAEPSPAFQTNRTSSDQPRRRASSSISGGSGPYGRQPSFAKPNEIGGSALEVQEQTETAVLQPEAAEMVIPQHQAAVYQVRGPSPGFVAPLSPVTPGAVPVTLEDHEAHRAQQRLLMKERIEQARKRKMEEEERLEAEKQERIRLKLASLGPDPKLQKAKAEEATTLSAPASAPELSASVQSPPKPPQPQATGEPQQYGMMKVHPLDSVKKLSPPKQQAEVAQELADADPLRPPPKPAQADVPKGPASTINGARPLIDPPRQQMEDNNLPLADRSGLPPKATSVGAEARAGWGDQRAPAGTNLWGHPNNNKALGNGTFDNSLAGYAPQDISSRAGSYSGQGWIASRTPTQPEHAQHSLRTPTQAEHSPRSQTVAFPAADTKLNQQAPADVSEPTPLAVNSEADSLFPTAKPAPIGPPQSLNMMQSSAQSWHQPSGMASGPPSTGLAAWNDFHRVASQNERAENEKFRRDFAAQREEERRTGVRQAPQYRFNESFKPVQITDQRPVPGTGQASTASPSMFGAVGSVSASDVASRNMNGFPPRGSRFFPQMAEAPPAASPAAPPAAARRAVTYSHPESPRTPSPPPAEESASLHPVYDGDQRHPIVHLPREKVVVKLPPAPVPTPPAADEQGLTWAARVSHAAPAPAASLRAVSTPIAQTSTWQERFNGLLGKKTPVAKPAAPPVLAVTSSSREPLDVLSPRVSAAVSLPQRADVDSLKEAGNVTSKAVEDEEDLFEDREAGSLPLVKIPRDSLLGPGPRVVASYLKQRVILVDPFSVWPFMVSNLVERPRHLQKDQFAIINLPGMVKSVKRDLPRRDGAAAVAVAKPRHVSSAGSIKHPKPRAGPKPRRASETPALPHGSAEPAQTPMARTGGQATPTDSNAPGSPLPGSTGGKTTPSSSSPGTMANGSVKALRGASTVHHGPGGRKHKSHQAHGPAQAPTSR